MPTLLDAKNMVISKFFKNCKSSYNHNDSGRPTELEKSFKIFNVK